MPPTGHSGSDTLLMRTFVEAVTEKLGGASGSGKNCSNALQAVESHLVALAAEESRLAGGNLVVMDEFLRR